jgi:hypothetical protein
MRMMRIQTCTSTIRPITGIASLQKCEIHRKSKTTAFIPRHEIRAFAHIPTLTISFEERLSQVYDDNNNTWTHRTPEVEYFLSLDFRRLEHENTVTILILNWNSLHHMWRGRCPAQVSMIMCTKSQIKLCKMPYRTSMILLILQIHLDRPFENCEPLLRIESSQTFWRFWSMTRSNHRSIIHKSFHFW